MTILGPWQVVHLNQNVEDEFDALPKDIKARFIHLVKMVEELGLPLIGEPYVKHVDGKLWAMRVQANSGYGRGFYCARQGRQVVVLHYFVKKSAATPRNELKLARQRLVELEKQ
jgi:phage-related protein